MKIEIEKIRTAMQENNIDQPTIEAVIEKLEAEAALEEAQQPEEVEEDPAPDADVDDNDLPKVKYEYVIILNDKDGHLKDKEIAGWVVQQEENADAALILSKMKDATKEQNETAKRKKNTITTLVDMFDGLKSKFLKSKNIKIKTKDLTRVIISNGKF
jgi:hypothetical protein